MTAKANWTVNVDCTVEKTKNDKWLCLQPRERGPVAPVVVAAADLPAGARTATITVTCK